MIGTQTKSIYINGQWRDIDPEKVESIYNPATEELITNVASGGTKETEEAIDAASSAFPLWSEMTGRERSRILYKATKLIRENKEHLAKILTMEQGKPLTEALTEMDSTANFLFWYAEEASRGYGEWIPSSSRSHRRLVIPQPIGVVGAITPWNFPAAMITRKLGPALAAGCTVVLKPSPETPLTAIELVKLFEAAGMPKGVVNLITGDAQAIGQEMLTNKKVKMITFTGSTQVGKYLMRESANQVKRLSLELGGHAPIIVFADADLEKATSMALASKFRNNGQTCICANRIYVHESIVDEFSSMLKEKAATLKVGNGFEEDIDLGPLINHKALEKVQEQVEDAVGQGAKVIHGGSKTDTHLPGAFFDPTILMDVKDEMVIMNEETFGPVIPIQTFTDEQVAIDKANDTDYGLASYIFTENTSRAIRVAEKLEYGIVGINDVFPGVPEAPFGGVKQSGMGKEGGHHGMDDFFVKKYISIGIDEE